jgi:hypothetical protein
MRKKNIINRVSYYLLTQNVKVKIYNLILTHLFKS